VTYQHKSGGRKIVVHGADSFSNEPIDQGALSLLELAHHGDDGVRSRDTLLGRDKSSRKVDPALGESEAADLLEQALKGGPW
jgi:hypothetical protein